MYTETALTALHESRLRKEARVIHGRIQDTQLGALFTSLMQQRA